MRTPSYRGRTVGRAARVGKAGRPPPPETPRQPGHRTHADRLPSLLETVRQGVKQAIARYRHRIACQRAEAELMEMSDRELADLGITRGEIHQKVWGQ